MKLLGALGAPLFKDQSMSNVKLAMDVYLNGLRNQHAVEMQAVGTIQNEMPRMEP